MNGADIAYMMDLVKQEIAEAISAHKIVCNEKLIDELSKCVEDRVEEARAEFNARIECVEQQNYDRIRKCMLEVSDYVEKKYKDVGAPAVPANATSHCCDCARSEDRINERITLIECATSIVTEESLGSDIRNAAEAYLVKAFIPTLPEFPK